ncbi:GGDEF domain-containing protein [Sphingomonas sp. OK281]|uniref:GGDEF domain-containing protein n=1 Tax=Sphingomonas sp. OK281 TaxID=1881067 RepID=UPI001114156B|nr:GGDEF domain-containing protein [Sphingomonas sp. OK281]
MFQDVTRRYEMEQALRRSAHTDELTGLTNRAGFNHALSAGIAGGHTNGTPLALLMIDLDGFKAVNDRCGHLRGDQVLRTIATALHASYLTECVTARLGGDEFAVIVRGTDQDAVWALVLKLLKDLRHSVDIGDGEQLCVSGTIGVSWLATGMTERDLLRQADIALYHGKHTERGTATTYSALIDR